MDNIRIKVGNAAGTEITVDSELSLTSENPVQNKVVTAALNGKQDTLTIDSELSVYSRNPVQNGTITSALNRKQDIISPEILKWMLFGAFPSEMHRNIFRGEYLGATVTSAQKAAIADGSFNDLFLGDYWTINGVNWRIADMDYYYEKFYAAEAGELQTTDKHHLVIVPDTAIYETFYKDGNTDTTGYAGSALHSAEAAEAIVNSAFPGMMLTYNDLLTTNSQSPYTQAAEECTVEAMSSAMVFGNYTVYNTAFSTISNPNTIARVPSCRQFALFRIAPLYIQTENYYFLRDSCSYDVKVEIAFSSPRHIPWDQKAYHRPFFLLGVNE